MSRWPITIGNTPHLESKSETGSIQALDKDMKGVDRVIAAAKAAGPWPLITTIYVGEQELIAYRCLHCPSMSFSDASAIEHHAHCTGIAMRDALAQLEDA